MDLRAFESNDEVESFCEELDDNELADRINRGYEEYGYKIDTDECAFTKYELGLMNDILSQRT